MKPADEVIARAFESWARGGPTQDTALVLAMMAAATLRKGEDLEPIERAIRGKRRVSAAMVARALAETKFRRHDACVTILAALKP